MEQVGPIPITAIFAWTDRFCATELQKEVFLEVLLRADKMFMEMKADEAEARNKESNAKANKTTPIARGRRRG